MGGVRRWCWQRIKFCKGAGSGNGGAGLDTRAASSQDGHCTCARLCHAAPISSERLWHRIQRGHRAADRPCLSALIVLNEARWHSLAAALSVDPHSANASEAAPAVLQRINELLADMPKHGVVRAVHPMLEPWTIQDGLLTPTLKVKRKAIEHRFRDEIAALYEQLGRSAGRKMSADGGTCSGRGLHDGPQK